MFGQFPLLGRLANKLSARPFFRDVMSVSFGTAAGMALGIAFLPLLSRLYSPEEFGIYASFLSILAPVLAVASLRYDLAIPVPRSDREALGLVAVAGLVTASIALVVGVIALASGTAIWRWLGVPEVAPWAWVLSIGVLFGGSYQIASFWATRKGMFGALGLTKATQAGVMLAIQLVGSVWSGAGGLILGEIVGRGAGTGTLARPALRRLRVIVRLGWEEVRGVAIGYIAYPKYMALSAGLAVATVHTLPLAYAIVYDVDSAGQIGLASKILLVPAMLIGRSVSQVFLKSASQAAQSGGQVLWGLYKKILKRLALLGLVPFLGIALIAGPAFPLIFGPEWQEAGWYAAILSAASFAQFVISPLTHGLIVLGGQKMHLIWDMARFVSLVGVFVLAARTGLSAYIATAGVACVIVVSYLCHVLLTLSLATRKPDLV